MAGALCFIVFVFWQVIRRENALEQLDATIGVFESPEGAFDGIDVSHHQGFIDWTSVAAEGKVKFVYVKATEGSTLVDPSYRENVEGARKQGILVGSYHFLSSLSDVVGQFINFSREVKREEQDLLPMIDVEWSGMSQWTPRQMQDSLALFAYLVQEYYGVQPLIYADAKFYGQRLTPRFDDFPLFIAHYREFPPVVEKAHRLYLWQRDEHGRVAGIEKDVDLDVLTKGTTLSDIMIGE
ncbi:MAG: glycosyl hydrolase family 25 [Prevotella sp.]|nr:glycosyl hydrolase family 25 [Prevotella sp.]